MITLRKSAERGQAHHGWLNSQHTFSFASYYDPQHMGFRALRVINEDRIAGGTGFDPHGHRDMEIISYVVDGALEHRDSAGNVAIIRPGEVQRMSAGTGMTHSEYNQQEHVDTHFFQIWITPDAQGKAFGYGQKSFENDLNSKDLVLVISKEGREGSISINQDADLYISRLKQGKTLEYALRPGRYAWLQMVKGQIQLNGQEVNTGDGVQVNQEQLLKIAANKDSEFMLFDLA